VTRRRCRRPCPLPARAIHQACMKRIGPARLISCAWGEGGGLLVQPLH
jgi:hypothetical protein